MTVGVLSIFGLIESRGSFKLCVAQQNLRFFNFLLVNLALIKMRRRVNA